MNSKFFSPRGFKLSSEAIELQKELSLNDFQIYILEMMKHFNVRLRNDEAFNFFKFTHISSNKENWKLGDRKWVKRQLATLVKEGILEFESLRDCRGANNTSHYWYIPNKQLATNSFESIDKLPGKILIKE